jgi:uncharacterized protein HemX
MQGKSARRCEMPYNGIGSNNWVKWIVGAVFFLLLAAVVLGLLLAGTYWANPSLREAESETIRIENAALEDQRNAEAEKQRLENKITEENWEIESAARRREIEDNSIARQERAKRNLVWLDHWNRFGIFTVAVVVVALLVAFGVRVVIPPVVKACKQAVDHRIQLVQQQRMELRERLTLETKIAERVQREFRLEQMRLQRTRALEKARGNGKGHKTPEEHSIMPSHIAA